MKIYSKFVIEVLLLFIIVSAYSQNYNSEILSYRTTKQMNFLKDERSPLKKESDLKYLNYFEPDSSYSVNCTFEFTPNAMPFNLPTYSGGTRLYIEYGTATCPIKSDIITLKIYRNLALHNAIYKNHLFLPIKDKTSGDLTYGGGRYMDLQIEETAKNVIIDFNKLYNPWCAYSDGFNCPIPPKDNHLNISILAGEKNFTGPVKH
jgi:uncharacterized protein